ncbi:MAG: flagellar biosynthesis anti-sigma factor FlgM [Deltaproteobacteria bacterium RBG_13_58_19]|nr:MAG: flagellar biosynthesis anti-sigma factor FlgM [Deltaproteobacteria bacterium RBG_13_58_19]
MKVNDINGIGVEQLQPNQTGSVAPATEKTPESQSGSSLDVIQLSTEARLMQKASQVVAATDEVRSEKVSALKEQVQQGTYEVDSQKVANSMISSLLMER